ncbi:LuxR family transcriptional regulator [soil metagenome]
MHGEPGVGKTRLLRELTAELAESGKRTTLVVATDSSHSVALGAFLPSIRSSEIAHDRSDEGVLHLARQVREKLGTGSDVVIAIDDVDLLDPASAGVVHQLVQTGALFIGSLRSGERAHATIASLWRNGQVVRVAVPPLSTHSTRELVSSVLGGEVDRGLERAVFERTRGNPLLSRELVVAARSSGSLGQKNGIWRVITDLPIIPSAVEFLGDKLQRLGATEQRMVELVALGEPLAVQIAERLVQPEVVEGLELQGIIAFDDSHEPVLRLSHPLYRDAVEAGLGNDQRAARFGELVDAARSVDGPNVDTAWKVRLGSWRLDAGLLSEPSELIELAELAHTSHPRLSDRLRRAAEDQHPSLELRFRIANLLAHQHRLDDAERVISTVELVGLPSEDRAAATLSRCFLLVMPGHRPAEALELLETALSEDGPVADLLAVKSTALWKLGRIHEAIELSREVFEDTSAPFSARTHAGLTLASALFHADQSKAQGRVAARLAPMLEQVIRELPEGKESLALVDVSALAYVDMNLSAARASAQRGYDQAMMRGDDGIRAQYGHELGWVELLTGEIEAGVRLTTEAVAAEGIWCQTMRYWFGAINIEALELAGRHDEARQALLELKTGVHSPLYDLNLAMAEAAVLAGSGELVSAAERLNGSATVADRSGDRVFARFAWYTAIRYGDVASARSFLAHRPAPVTAIEAIMRDHALALLKQNAETILDVADRLSEQGLGWFAAETTASAVEVAVRTGDAAVARRGWERISIHRVDVPSLRSPIIETLAQRVVTRREFQVAALAAKDRTDREIADELAISLRTVQTHLGRVYLKLHANGRAELAERLGRARN